MKIRTHTKAFYIIVNPVVSKFAKALQQRLRELVINPVYRRETVKHGRSSQSFHVTQQPLNKVEQFERFTACVVSCPKHATTVEGARKIGSRTLFARTLTNSTNGRGIVEFEGESDDYPRAPLYTEYIPKKSEYRFHVFGDKVIDVQEKRKKRGFAGDRDTRIRNVNNGYVYCRDGVNPPDGSPDLAIRAVKALNYQYGAVDVIYNEKRNQSYVLEVNSRPGLMGTTLDSYCNALIEQFNLVRK